MESIGVLPPGGRVCIVGAGSIGVFIARVVAEYGLVPIVYEASDRVGGVWTKHWKTLTTNSSAYMMTLDEPRMEQEPTVFPHKSHICRYVEKYREHHGIDVKFGHTVTSAIPEESRGGQGAPPRWRVTVDGPGQSTGKTEVFDALFCCHGQYNHPKWPQVPGLFPVAAVESESGPATVGSGAGRDGFAGRVLHSQDFDDGSSCRGKDVLVIGIGNSALDVVLDCVRHGARSIRVACRHSAVILPVSTADGKPIDAFFNSRRFAKAPKFLKTYWFWDPVLRLLKEFTKAGLPEIPKGTPGVHVRISNLKEHQAWTRALRNGKITFCAKVRGFDEHSVIFDDGVKADIDVVVCCTGYKYAFPFLTRDITNEVTETYRVGGDGDNGTKVSALLLHRRVMHPRLQSLCFFGMLNTLGNEAAVGELQGRWACAMLTATAETACTRASIQNELAESRQRIADTRPLFPMFTNYVTYADALAKDIGCQPPPLLSWSTLFDPRLALSIAVGAVPPAQYRLRGPHANPVHARSTLLWSKI